MIGRSTGETYRLGDPVKVKLVEAAPVAGALRFELLSEGRYSRKPTGGTKARGPKPARKAEKSGRGAAPKVRVKRRGRA